MTGRLPTQEPSAPLPVRPGGKGTAALHRVLSATGLLSLHRSPRDVKLLCVARIARQFGYSASTLVLVAFLEAVGASRARAGLFMTLTLAGDVAVSFLLTLVADALGRRVVLGAGAILMAASGIVFTLSENYYVLLVAAVLGVISPSGAEIGPFRAIEESVLAHLTPSASRSDVYAWYNLSAMTGGALGMITCGWILHHLRHDLGWEMIDAYRSVFVAYAALGLIKLALVCALSQAVEIERVKNSAPVAAAAAAASGGNGAVESTPLLADGASAAATPEALRRRSRLRALLPPISAESRLVVLSLCLLFALDSFSSGLAPTSWLTYFFRSRYGLDEGTLGSIFFTTAIISALSMIVASGLAKHFGNVNTMVFTHLPSAIFLALIPVPGEVHGSLVFLVLRACTQSMDSAPRSAFMAAIVLPGERTAVLGLVNVVKTTAQSLGPWITGVLADRQLFWVAFLCAGTLKATYDLGLLAVFKNHERERAERERLEAERSREDGAGDVLSGLS